MNEIEVGHQSLTDINANVLAATGMDVHNNKQLFCRKSVKCSCYKAVTTRTKTKKKAYKDRECVVTIQWMTSAKVHE